MFRKECACGEYFTTQVFNKRRQAESLLQDMLSKATVASAGRNQHPVLSALLACHKQVSCNVSTSGWRCVRLVARLGSILLGTRWLATTSEGANMEEGGAGFS